MQVEKIIESSLLYDFYGQLLSENQQKIFSLYYEDNLSLSEIAAELEISRQGVHDALKKSEKRLQGYEEKLGLVKKFSATGKIVAKIDESIERLIEENQENESLKNKLGQIKRIIDNFQDLELNDD